MLNQAKAFVDTAQTISTYRGAFETGYPCYVLGPNFEGNLSIVYEQLRYNEELRKAGENNNEPWTCPSCCKTNDGYMRDLKNVCYPCSSVDNAVKPRKLMNRLPDMDLWFICENGKLNETSSVLSEKLQRINMFPSDIDIKGTIEVIKSINDSLERNETPRCFLPIDAHIIEYDKLLSCIIGVPKNIEDNLRVGKAPYIPIAPLSLRKEWQYDDHAYNFVLDFLFSFSEWELEPEMEKVLKDSRKQITDTFTTEQIQKIIRMVSGEANKRRIDSSQAIREKTAKRINSWRDDER